MGTIKSMASFYSRNQYLFWYIEKDSLSDVQSYLNKYPDIVNQPMTKDSKVLPLCRAVWRGNYEMVKLLLDGGANINQVSELGETAALMAAKRDRLDILKLLIERGADIDYRNQNTNLQVIEYALLGGFYDVVFYLYPAIKDKDFKTPEQYQALSIKYRYRYVNFDTLLDGLAKQIPPSNIGGYLKRPKIVLKDPVIDPRQSWGQWIKRVSEFKEPPLVQRDDLPEDLQPQNRKMGRIHHFLNSIVARGSKIKPTVYPSQSKTQVDVSQQQMMRTKKEQTQSAFG